MRWTGEPACPSRFCSLSFCSRSKGPFVIDESTYGIKLLVSALATWRVTHLLAHEDGPADIIVRFRARLGQSFVGTLMDCFNCLSFWIAAPIALYVSRTWLSWIFNSLALSGAACLLQSLTHESQIHEGQITESPLSPSEGTTLCVAVKNEER
jgi:Protein of unknown function (DUF1360)